MAKGLKPPTKPAQGVMATSPATMPEQTPSVVGWPSFSHSTKVHTNPPAAAATKVFRKATAAMPSADSAEPALKPNQPKNRMPVPSIVIVRLCGGIGVDGHPWRLPSSRITASAAAPAFMWTTAPPAKSRAPRSASQPPAKTQWAMGL